MKGFLLGSISNESGLGLGRAPSLRFHTEKLGLRFRRSGTESTSEADAHGVLTHVALEKGRACAGGLVPGLLHCDLPEETSESDVFYPGRCQKPVLQLQDLVQKVLLGPTSRCGLG